MIILKKHAYFVLSQNIVQWEIYYFDLIYFLNSIILIKKGGSLADCIRNKRNNECKFDDEQIFKWKYNNWLLMMKIWSN